MATLPLLRLGFCRCSPSSFSASPPSSLAFLLYRPDICASTTADVFVRYTNARPLCLPLYSPASSRLHSSLSKFLETSRVSSSDMVKPLDVPGGSNSNSNERTPLLSISVRSTVSSRSGGFLGPQDGEAFHSARTRRASLAQLATQGGESEFGGEKPGLARFREEWALSQAPQHPTLLESTFGQSAVGSGAPSRDRSRDPSSGGGGSGDALDSDDDEEDDDRPAEAGEILDQVRVLAEEVGYVVPPERKDATRDLREAGILAAWATPQILIGFCRYSIVGANLISLGRLGQCRPACSAKSGLDVSLNRPCCIFDNRNTRARSRQSRFPLLERRRIRHHCRARLLYGYFG